MSTYLATTPANGSVSIQVMRVRRCRACGEYAFPTNALVLEVPCAQPARI